jgi:tRNA/tmRNA/rRNA uracil-C5-methylase (TrmA/RlmC/RlmD family)
MVTAVSQMTKYRREHPAFYEAEKLKNCERLKLSYATNLEFKERMLEHSRKYYADPEKRAKKAERQKLRYQQKKLEKAELSVN